MCSGSEALGHRNAAPREGCKTQIAPTADSLHDTRDDRSGGCQPIRIGRKVRRHFNPPRPRTDTNAGGSFIPGKKHDRGGHDVHEQPGEIFHAGRSRRSSAPAPTDSDVVVRAETLQLDAVAMLRLPKVQLTAYERDAVIERSREPSEAALLELHNGRCNLDHPGVEVHRCPVRQLERPSRAMHERHGDEAAWISKKVLGLCRNAVEQHGELGLEPAYGPHDAAGDRLALPLFQRVHRRQRAHGYTLASDVCRGTTVTYPRSRCR